MRKKLSLLLMISVLTFSLIGCTSKTNNDKENTEIENVDEKGDENKENTDTEDSNVDEDAENVDETKTDDESTDDEGIPEGQMIDIKDEDVDRTYMLYLYNAYEDVSDFYTYFSSIGEAIDSKDETLKTYYLDLISSIKSDLNKMEVPEKYKDAHTYLVSGINNYYEGVSILNNSFNEIDYDEYKKADELMKNASSEVDTYISYIDGSLDDFLSYVDILSELDYYFKLITIYEFDETFTDDENKALFTLERSICNYVQNREDLLLNILSSDEKSAQVNLDNMKNSIKEIESIDIDNEYITEYKQNTIKYLTKYLEYCTEFNQVISDDSFTYSYFNITEEMQTFAYEVYDNLESISNFYKTYDIDLGYTTSASQLSETENETE